MSGGPGTGGLRRLGGRVARASELSEAVADAERVGALAEAVAENTRQDLLLHGLLDDLERSLVGPLSRVLGESR